MNTDSAERISPAVARNGDVDWVALLTQALTVPGQLGTTYCRFYRYSLQNQILLWSQGVTEPCAPFSVWKRLGRIPVKGGGRFVMHPLPFRKTNKTTGEEEVVVCRFGLKRTTFPYSNTEGPDVEWPQLPEWEWQRALTELEIEQVPYALIDGNTQGYSSGRTVAISPVAVYPAKTGFHELAHVVLGHTTADDSGDQGTLCRGVAEFQAEATAYLLAHETGLTQWAPEESRAYIQGWLGGEQVGDRDIRAVFSAADKILAAGRAPAGAAGVAGTPAA